MNEEDDIEFWLDQIPAEECRSTEPVQVVASFVWSLPGRSSHWGLDLVQVLSLPI